MTARTYTLDADMCDEWVRLSVFGTSSIPIDKPMVDAIRAQQPKPGIRWAMGLRLRLRGTWATAGLEYMCCRRDDEFWDKSILNLNSGRLFAAEEFPSYDKESFSFDPEKWEVVA